MFLFLALNVYYSKVNKSLNYKLTTLQIPFERKFSSMLSQKVNFVSQLVLFIIIVLGEGKTNGYNKFIERIIFLLVGSNILLFVC